MKIKAEQVIAYLQDHVNFFYDHPELVRELKIPTDSGVACLFSRVSASKTERTDPVARTRKRSHD